MIQSPFNVCDMLCVFVFYRHLYFLTSSMRLYSIKSKQPPVSLYVCMEGPFSVSLFFINYKCISLFQFCFTSNLIFHMLKVLTWAAHLLWGRKADFPVCLNILPFTEESLFIRMCFFCVCLATKWSVSRWGNVPQGPNALCCSFI